MSLLPKTSRSSRAAGKAGRAVVRAIPAAEIAAKGKARGANGNGDEHNEVAARASIVFRSTAPSDALAAPFAIKEFVAPTFPDRVFDIGDFNASSEPVADNTAAFAAAIEACADAGGGRVLVPAGTWLTGPIHLRSNVELHLSDEAIVRFSAEPDKYLPAVFVRWGGIECYNHSPLIYARGCKNIAITGRGKLRGNGKPWWTLAKVQQRVTGKLHQLAMQNVPVEERVFGTDLLPLRPQFIMPIECTNVLLEDFTIDEGGPFGNVHIAYCNNVIIRRITIDAPGGTNNDGIDIDSSRDVLVEDCDLRAADDCVSLKSGMNEDGWRVDRPTENVVIRRIRAAAGHGGVAIGSEMSGGVRNVFVHDCEFDGLTTGIRMKAARGRGGVVEEIHVQDIRMGRILGDAIQVTTEHSSFVARDGRIPTFRNIHILDVTCDHARTAVRMLGLADRALQNINLQDVAVACEEGLTCAAVNVLNLVNVRITPRTGPVLSVKDGQEVVIQGLNNADSSSVFLDLRGRQTKNIRLRGNPDDKIRPAVVLGIDVPRDALVHE